MNVSPCPAVAALKRKALEVCKSEKKANNADLIERSNAMAAVGPAGNKPISVYRLGEMPIQSCGQSVSAPRGNAGARFNAHTELRTKRRRSAQDAIYRNRLIA